MDLVKENIERDDSDNNNQDNSGYDSGWDHFSDESKRLDFKIHIRLLMQQGGEVNQAMDPFKGLVVSEEEVLRLLTRDDSPHSSREDIRMLAQRLQKLESDISRKLEWSESQGILLPLIHLSRVFQLTPFEQQTLFLCLAVELDRKYEKLFAYIQDDVTCKYPTADMAMKLICQTDEQRFDAYSSFSHRSTLNRYFLQRDEGADKKTSLLSRVLKLDERIVHYITDAKGADGELDACCTIFMPQEVKEPLIIAQDLQQRLQTFAHLQENVNVSEQRSTIYYLWGNEGAGKRLHVKHLCESINKPLLVADIRSMLNGNTPFEILLMKVEREARIVGAVAAFHQFEVFFEENAPKQSFYHFLQYLAAGGRNVFVLTDRQWIPPEMLRRCVFIDMEIPIPSETERLLIWETFGSRHSTDSTVNWDAVAGKFQFTPGQIFNALSTARQKAVWDNGNETITHINLHAACSQQSQHKLAEKAVKIRIKYGWDDIVLPLEQKELLRNACNQMKYRQKVHGEWGFGQKLSYGKGLSMLFSGPPGTGKTMSAQVVAHDLQLELYKIDLSQVISKYIGETEKNLHEIFREARLSGSVLFFDESDALFGKRSEVKEANDKYANVETAYLLQKMEEYDGITILATNLLQNIDEAFLRRINFVIRFPFPDAEYRQLLWKSAFPQEAPVDNGIDYDFLARKLTIAGGNIKNIAMSAAFLAAGNNEPIGMRYILAAARHELQKSGRILLKEELGIYEDLLK